MGCHMNVINVNDKETMSIQAAEMVVNVLKSVENPVVGFATGSTPERMYELLIEKYNNNEICFKNVTSFNLDEYVGLGPEHTGSYQYYMNEGLFKKINIKNENTYIPNGLAKCLKTECEIYEREIKSAGNIDFLMLGIGENGHIGFNEPGTPFDSRTHIVRLTPSTREVNARFFTNIKEVPKEAITMGLGTIMEAKEIMLLVQGDRKAAILNEVVHGKVTTNVPASILQEHPNVTLITDLDV